MRHAMTRILLLVGALMALAYPAHAQPVQGLAVAACGTPGITITAGTPGPFTVDTTGKLCDSSSGGGGGGLSVVDQTAWVQGTSAFTPTGCVFNDTATLSSGQEGTVRCTTDRQFKALDSAVLAAVQAPVPACAGSPCTTVIGAEVLFQGTTAISATNGLYTNLLQGNAVLATGNPIFAQLTAGTAAIGTINGNVNVTPTNCSGTIASGGTAQNAIAATATIHGFTIANIDSTSGSGEPMWVSFTTTAAASTVASYPLSAPAATTFTGLSSYSSPLGFGLNTALSIVAATSGHKFSCTYW